MLKIIGRQDSGKTRQLLQNVSSNSKALVVCSNPNRMADKARAYGLYGINFISYTQYLNNIKSFLNNDIYIDDLDLFLGCLDYNIRGYNVNE